MIKSKKIKKSHSVPYHLGIIIDGNRRWAAKKSLSNLAGHQRGFENIRRVSSHAFRQGVKIVTIFAFSTENWKRSSAEVSYLIKLIRLFIKQETAKIIKQGLKLKFFGRLSDFDRDLRQLLKKSEKAAAHGTKGQINVCLSYGGRDEIVRAVKKIIRAGLKPGEVNEKALSTRLDSTGLPDPDLIIRTSGEQRLSGFLTWQSVYSEIYFSPQVWPDFSCQDLDKAFYDYACRQRRFGV